MNSRLLVTALTVVAMFGATRPSAAEDPAMRDLAATIALQGKPCNKIVSVTRNGDSNYLASCQDGNRYHVFVDPNGRVVVQKL
jgi:hypothetical protein